MTMSTATPSAVSEISVVVAVRPEFDATACLSALRPQVNDRVELIVVASRDVTLPVELAAPVIRHDGLVPEQWAAGIAMATGEFVALTVGSVVPSATWVRNCLELQRVHGGIVGGVVLPGDALSLSDWALYFCRYARYMLPLRSETRLDAPGDNVCYRRAELMRYEHCFESAFLEPFVHAQMVGDGVLERIEPSLVVRTAPGYRPRSFARQRYEHGRAHGYRWAIGRSRARLLLGLGSTPLVPFVLWARSGAEVFGRRDPKQYVRFLASTPPLLWFICAWAAGEYRGRFSALRNVKDRAS